MRNLKRTLSLALAAVMLMGMMVVGAGAASKDFTDAGEIKNVEAVDVMVALGILEGGDKGDFQPNSILTREQAAKIICYLLLGEDSAEKLSTNSAVFNDVAADRWSAPYIGYCVNLGILAGDGNGNFFPEGKLTGAAFAKMLLVALGYDPAIEEYVGNSWTINVAADAIEAGISPKGVVLTNELSRQDAAQMAYQTLTATVVKYDNKGTTVIGSDGMQVIVGASSASAVSNITSNYDKTSTPDNVMQFCEKYFSDLTKVAGDADAFGRPADYQWQLDGDEVYNATLTPDQTYTTATKGGDIYKDLGKPSGATYTYYVDGKEVSNITSYYTGFAIASGDSDKIGGKGSVVEVFETADDEYTVTVTNTFVGEVSDWNEADEDKDVEESIDISALTQPADVAGASGTLNANFETVAFDESDVDDETVVLFTAAWDDDNNEYVIKSASVAEKVEDLELTSTTGTTKFVAGGTTYEYGTVNYSESVVLKDSINVYLDTYGYVVYVEKYQAGSSNYAFVLDAKANDKEWVTDDTTYTAKLLLTDGTVVTVNTDDQDSTTLKLKYVSYTVDDDDVYTLTAKDSTSAAGASIDVTKGTSKFTVGTDTYYANSSTIFLVYDNTNEEYAVYTGMANVPTMEGTATVYVNTKGGVGSVASIVYISAADTVVSDANKGLVYIIAGSESALVNDADKGEYYTYDAVIDGEITTVDVAKAAQLSGDVLASKLTYNSKGVVTNITEYEDDNTKDDYYFTGTGTLKTTDGTVGLNGAYYTYASDVVVYKVEDNEFSKVNVTSIRDDADDTFKAVLKDGEITAIFITVVE